MLIQMFKTNNVNKFISFSIIIISLYAVFLHYMHVNSFGDQASENIITVEQLENYSRTTNISVIKDNNCFLNRCFFRSFNQTDKQITFQDYVKGVSKDLHGIRSLEENKPIYNIDAHARGIVGESLLVKALPYVLHQFTHKLISMFSSSNDYTFSYFALSLFIFFFSALSIIEFSKQLKIKNLQNFLLIGLLSNIYIMQLFRSGLENHVLLFLPIYFYSLSFIIKVFSKDKLKIKDFIIYPFIFSLSFFNGYPTTSTILPFFLLITTLSYAFLGIGFVTYIKKLLIVVLGILISMLFFIPESVYWSLTIGEHISYHLKIIPERTMTMFGILFSSGGDAEFSAINLIKEKNEIFSRFLKNIFFTPYIYHSPHEPGILLGISFFNIVERVFFIVGIISIFVFKQSRLTKLTNISILICIAIRLFTHDNLQINKASFDYYALCIYIVYFGIYSFYNLLGEKKVLLNKIMIPLNNIYFSFRFRKLILYKNNDNNNYYIKFRFIFFVIVIIISFLGNLVRFNKIFVNEFNESLRELSAVGPLKKFIENNYEDSIFLLQQQHGYTATVDRIFMLDSRYEYEMLANFGKLNFDRYKNVYIITFVTHQVGPLRNFIYGNGFFNTFGVDKLALQETLNSSAGNPSINIHEIKRTTKLSSLTTILNGEYPNLLNRFYPEYRKIQNLYSIDNNKHNLSKILLKDYDGFIEFSCGKKRNIVEVNYNGYDKYVLNFENGKENGLYYFETIFANTVPDKNFELTKISSLNLDFIKQHQITSNWNSFISSKNKEFEEIISFRLKEKISSFYIAFPFMFHHDFNKKNKLSVKYYDKKSYKKDIMKLRSNGSGMRGKYINFNGHSDLVQFKSYHSEYNRNDLSFEFKLFNNKNQDNSFLKPKNTNIQQSDTDSLRLHFIDKDISNFVNNCEEPLTLYFDNKSIKKENIDKSITNIEGKIDVYVRKK